MGRIDHAHPDQSYASEVKPGDCLVKENRCEQRAHDWHDVEVKAGCGRPLQFDPAVEAQLCKQ